MELLSIIIPAYNVERYIGQCIESVINQTYNNLEIIIVDDGSRDATGSIIDGYAKKDMRIKCIHQCNGGQSNARNNGIKAATGNYIMFLDSDDWLESTCCEVALGEMLHENAELILFEYNKEFLDRTMKVSTYSSNKIVFDSANNQGFFLYDMRTITVWGKIYSRQIVEEILFDEKMRIMEDVWFNYCVYERINKAVYINKSLLHYRMLQSSAAHGWDNVLQKKLEYPLQTMREWKKSDCEKNAAYYSAASIAYIVICQNEICSNPQLSLSEKRTRLKQLGENEIYRDLFNHVKNIKIPLSRKLIVLLGKFHMYNAIISIVTAKIKHEKRED